MYQNSKCISISAVYYLVGVAVLMLATTAAQLLLRHAFLSFVIHMFSSKDAFVHFLMLSMYCILGRPLLLFPGIIPRMHVLRIYVYCMVYNFG